MLFYAAERNDVECVRLLIEYGCDVSINDVDDVPVLAFAVLRTKFTLRDPVEVVKTLVAFGANPRRIPKDTWVDYIATPPLASPDEAAEDIDLEAFWCTDDHRKLLQPTLNLSVRYFLHKAIQIAPARARAL